MLAQLSWGLELVEVDDAKRLRVTWTVFNGDFERIHVCDGLVIPRGDGFVVTEKLIVNTAGAAGEKRPGEVVLVRGSVSSDRPALRLAPATFAPLEPGASLSFTCDVAWPLVGYHPLGGAGILGDPKTVELQVQVFAGEPTSWEEMRPEVGAPIKVPQGYRPLLLSTGARPLPG